MGLRQLASRRGPPKKNRVAAFPQGAEASATRCRTSSGYHQRPRSPKLTEHRQGSRRLGPWHTPDSTSKLAAFKSRAKRSLAVLGVARDHLVKGGMVVDVEHVLSPCESRRPNVLRHHNRQQFD